MKITRLDLPRCKVGEGPVWDTAEQALYYIDILEKTVMRWDPVTGDHASWQLPEMVGSIAVRAGGGVIAALPDGIHALDTATGALTPYALMDPADPRIQLADGKTDRAGRFIFGTSHRQAKEPLGGLYSLGRDGVISQLDAGLTLGNGPCFSPDNRTLYHADSMAQTIYAYDYDPSQGTVSNRRVFFDTTDYGPIPDGATIDADGAMWVAICEGGVVLQIAPDGTVLREIAMPTKLPASCMFFGEKLDRLFVPSIDPSFLGREPAEADGWCYVIDGLGVRGLPEPRFHG